MNDESNDFIAKLRQIEEQANALSAELPPGLAKTRLQQILVLAKTLRGRLEFGSVTLAGAASAAAAALPKPPRA